MALKSAILQKKLRELELELADVFRIPLDPLPGPRHWISFDDVPKRIEFLKNLLSYEEVTSQSQNPDQLHDIADKIAALEAAFQEWGESRTSALGNFDDTLSICSDCTHAILNDGTDSVYESETPVSAPEDLDGEKWPEKCFEKAEKPETTNSGEEARRSWGKTDKIAALEAEFQEWGESRTSAVGNFDDTLSICSDFTHAILNDGTDSVYESDTPVSAPEDLDGEKWPEKCFEEAEKPGTTNSGEETRRSWGKIGNYCGIFGSGVIVGAICMVELSSILSMIDAEAFLLPPT